MAWLTKYFTVIRSWTDEGVIINAEIAVRKAANCHPNPKSRSHKYPECSVILSPAVMLDRFSNEPTRAQATRAATREQEA